MRNVSTLLLTAICAVALGASPQQPSHGRPFPPEELGVLESPDRDEWQQPERIMDALRIADGSRVADLGAGGGWFTIRLARRVGQNGVVYAQDIQKQMIDSIRRRVRGEGLENVEFVLGTETDPHLPEDLDAVLIVDTYPEIDDRETVLRHIARSLKPTGRVGIVDFKLDGAGGPGPPIQERLDPKTIKQDAHEAGLRLIGEETFLRYQYFLILGL